jgi:putative flippase GtrA
MTLTAPALPDYPPNPRAGRVEIVIPVYNEERALASSIRRLHRYLTERFPFSWVVTIADNASTDGTWIEACRLARELDRVHAVHLDAKGRGRAQRAAWTASRAEVVAYMDVDLSTGLDALLPLVAPLLSGHSDVAIGSRLSPTARVTRGSKREFISRTYNLLLRTMLRSRFTDAQCGFKAIRADAARQLLPLIEDEGWFFDTELLVLAEYNGFRIHEVAVDWVDDPDSRVDVVATAREDLKGVARLLLALARGHGRIPVAPSPRRAAAGGSGRALHFASVGLLSTVTFTVLFVVLFGPLGPTGADIAALALAAGGNLAVNRRYTFGAATDAGRLLRRSLWLSPLAVVATLGALAVAQVLGWSTLGTDLALVTLANLAATTVRYELLLGRRSQR